MALPKELLSKKIKYLNCNDCPEWGEELNFICVDGKCKDNGLICSICRSKNHQKCKVMPLKKFLHDLSQKVESK